MEWRSVASLLLSLGMVIMLFPRPLHSTDDGPFSQYLDGGELVDQDITLEQLQQEDDTHPIYSDSMETEDGDDEHDEEEEEEEEEKEEEVVSSSSFPSSSFPRLQEFSQAKILDDRLFDYSSRSSFKEDVHSKFSDILTHRYYGPPTLGFLDGMCIKHEAGRFEYNICPFQNITNKRVSSHRVSLLGKWEGWHPFGTNDMTLVYNYSMMSFGRGDACGGDTKTTTLVLGCGDLYNSIQVVDVDDSVGPCEYKIVLGLPLHCSLLLGKHPSAYLDGNGNNDESSKRRGRERSNTRSNSDSEASLSDLLAEEEARISSSGGGFSTAHEDGNTEVSMRDSYTEQIQTLKRQVDELTARLEATLTAEGG